MTTLLESGLNSLAFGGKNCGSAQTDILTAASFLSLLTPQKVKGVIPSNISIASTYAWYMALTPYETIFLHLIMLQILLLRYLEIIPINLNQLFAGEPSGRKKRAVGQSYCSRDENSEAFFKLLRKLDEQNCGVRTLCELQAANSLRSFKLSEEAQLIISALRASRKRRLSLENGGRCGTEVWAVRPFEDAVLLGMQVKFSNSTACEYRYPICPLNKEDILNYVNQIFGSLRL